MCECGDFPPLVFCCHTPTLSPMVFVAISTHFFWACSSVPVLFSFEWTETSKKKVSEDERQLKLIRFLFHLFLSRLATASAAAPTSTYEFLTFLILPPTRPTCDPNAYDNNTTTAEWHEWRKGNLMDIANEQSQEQQAVSRGWNSRWSRHYSHLSSIW